MFRFVVLSAVLAMASPAFAQSSVEGYLAGGAGAWSNPSTSGSLFAGVGGVEWRLSPFAGIAAEGGVMTTLRGGLALIVGADGRAHFGDSRTPHHWAPYALGGYSRLAFFEGSDNAVQLGAGADYRLSSRRALRIEIRDLIRSSNVTSHYWTARIGLSFK